VPLSRMPFLKLIRLGLVAATIMLGAAAPSLADAPPLRIGYVAAMANAPVLIAQQEGYFKAQGLAVELTPFGDGAAIQQAIAAGKIDVAYTGAPPVYQWFARGLPLRILAKVNYGQAALVVKAGGPIQNLSDLKGQKIAGNARGSGMDVLLRGYVLQNQAKLTPDKDVQIVQMPVGNMNAALDTGIVGAAFEWEPFISQAVLRGTGSVLFDVNQALPHYPWYVIAATQSTIDQRPDDLIKLLRANHQAIAFLYAHPEESDRIIATDFKLGTVQSPDGKTITPEAIVAEARKRLGWSDQITPSDAAFIQQLMGYSLQQGFLTKPLKASDVIDTGLWVRATAAQN
jgi:NitT/TauT family transport system substrate-binding protein